MNKDLTYQQSINILTSQGKFYINLGLERVQDILTILGNPQSELKFIHVAGTNGKGSVSAILSAILSKSPSTLKVGLFTSPHVFEYTERIKINGQDIEKNVFAQKIIKIVELAEKKSIHLTEFEILTVVAFDYFVENNVDIVVLETGLGGRLDATNVIKENLCSIITHIDLDHTERLGDTIEKIAFEKAGIIKENCPAVISSKNAGFELVKKISDEKNAQIYLAEASSIKLVDSLSLLGLWQKDNLALALIAVDILREKGFNIPQEAIEQGIKNVKHPCRFEYLKEQNILIDGAHNPNGTSALRESLEYYFPNQKLKFIFGCLNNKNYSEMMKNLFRSDDEIYFYKFSGSNACNYQELSGACEFIASPFSEFKKDGTLTVICGSFYMIKELLEEMGIK